MPSPDIVDPSRPAAFFDRDGVINLDHGYVGTIDRFDLVPSAAAALVACRAAGFLVFVVTNQSGIARGFFDEQALAHLHHHMRARLLEGGATIDDLRYCPHLEGARISRYDMPCPCRKPAPGMILDLSRRWNVDVQRSFLVGDKPSDLEAAEAAGVAGHLFSGGDLLAFVQPILAHACHKTDSRV